MALKTHAAAAAAAEFEAAGIADGAALDFSRPVELAAGVREAAFTVARTRPGSTPGGWLFVCQHHTPEVVWRGDYLEQPNGVLGIAEVIGVAGDLTALAGPWRTVFGGRVEQTADAVRIRAGGAGIVFLTPTAFADRFGGLAGAPGATPRLMALRLEVRSTDGLREVLVGSGLRYEQRGETVVVPAAETCGTLLEFAPA